MSLDIHMCIYVLLYDETIKSSEMYNILLDRAPMIEKYD